jgi:RNA polymerase-binding transcription factor DksA
MRDPEQHRLEMRARSKTHYYKNREKYAAYRKEYYRLHKKEMNRKRTEYRRAHPKEERLRDRAYHRTERSKRIKKDYDLKYHYGITLEQYDRMFESQNGACYVCGQPELNKRLSVDHNHDTGEVRHLLCQKCNMLVGCVETQYELVEKTIKYLKGEL